MSIIEQLKTRSSVRSIPAVKSLGMLDESTTARTSVSSCARVSNSSPYAVQNLAEGCKRNGELDSEIFYSIVKALTGFLTGRSLDDSCT